MLHLLIFTINATIESKNITLIDFTILKEKTNFDLHIQRIWHANLIN